MDKRTRNLLIILLRPVYTATAFVLKAVDMVLFGWLHWWMQRRANNRLAVEVLASLYFLTPEAVRMQKRTAVLPFNYATVELLYENLCFTFTRGRGEVNVLVSPRHAVNDTHQLAAVISALESRRLSGGDIAITLADAVSLIRPRIQALNEAFSQGSYSQFEARLRNQ